MAYSSDGYKSSSSSEDKRDPTWILSRGVGSTEDLEVHAGEADADEEEDDEEESYLISPETGDVSSALGPGASPSTVTETKKKIVSSSTILQVPSDISNVRARVFAMDEPIIWTGEQFNDYWKFVDNYWVHNSTTKTQNGQEVSNYWWRLWKESQTKSSSQGLRNKRIRITISPCGMKIKLYKTFDSPSDSHPCGRLMKVEISKHLTKRGGAVP